jgi:hypothetical protein
MPRSPDRLLRLEPNDGRRVHPYGGVDRCGLLVVRDNHAGFSGADIVSVGNQFEEPPPLHVLLPLLTDNERSFFTMLDGELDKIENFYLDREKEMAVKSEALEGQVQELNKMRQFLQASEPQPFLLLH